MKNLGRGKERKRRYSEGVVLAKLTFSDATNYPTPFDKMVGRTSEKTKGAMMVKKIKDMFSLSDIQIRHIVEQEARREIEEHRGIWRETNAVQWTRDEKGNIVSPFSKTLNTKTTSSFHGKENY